MEALRQLGSTDIPVTIVDLKEIMRGEFAENFVRKDFVPSEEVAICEAIEPMEEQQAKERQGKRTDKHSGNFPESSKGQSRDKVAKYVGKSAKTMKKAKATELKLRAERKLGVMLKEQEKHPPGPDPLHPEREPVPTLEEQGISYTQSHRWQKVADVSEERFQAFIEDATAKNEELTTAGLIRIAKMDAEHIPCVVTETQSDAELLELAISRNASHGLQLSQEDKKNMARTIYNATPEKDRTEKKKALVDLTGQRGNAHF